MSECLSRLKSKVPFWMLLEAWHEGGQIISMLQSAGRKAAACTVELSDQRMLWSSSILQVCLGLQGKVRPAYVCCPHNNWHAPSGFVMLLRFVADLLSLLVPNVDATNHIDGATARAVIQRSGCLGANQATSGNWPSRKEISKKRWHDQ